MKLKDLFSILDERTEIEVYELTCVTLKTIFCGSKKGMLKTLNSSYLDYCVINTYPVIQNCRPFLSIYICTEDYYKDYIKYLED